MQLVDNLSNMGKVYEGATESIEKLVETFKHEADGADRRMKVHEELIFVGGGLTDEEIVKVGGIITTDCNMTDYFFTLGGHFKKLYVYSLLQKRIQLCKALLGVLMKTNIISSFVSFPLFSNIVVKYMNRLKLFVDQFISINDTLCVF